MFLVCRFEVNFRHYLRCRTSTMLGPGVQCVHTMAKLAPPKRNRARSLPFIHGGLGPRLSERQYSPIKRRLGSVSTPISESNGQSGKETAMAACPDPTGCATGAVTTTDIYVSPDDTDTMKRLAMKIKPEWTSAKDLKIKDMSSGYINRNVGIYRTELQDGLFFRMLSEEGTIVDVPEALKVIEFLQTQKLCAPLRMVFQNGYALDFIVGDALTWSSRDRQYEPNIRKAVAQEMARYHSQKAYQVAEEFEIAADYSFLSDDLIDPCWEYLTQDKELDASIIKCLPTLEEFRTERDQVEKMMEDIQLEKAFCHTDINPSNIIMLDQGERALFVDYDFCRISYKAIDITWFFLCFVDMMEPDFKDYPDDEYRNQWMREYLQSQWEIDGRQRPLGESKFNLLRFQITKTHLWALLQYVYAILFVVRVGPPPHVTRNQVLGACKKCWEFYLSLRDDVMAMTLEEIASIPVTGKPRDKA